MLLRSRCGFTKIVLSCTLLQVFLLCCTLKGYDRHWAIRGGSVWVLDVPQVTFRP